MASGKKRRGLTFKDRKGYKKYSNSGESIHRHVAERKLGRKPRKGEVVHHKNRDKTDNPKAQRITHMQQDTRDVFAFTERE